MFKILQNFFRRFKSRIVESNDSPILVSSFTNQSDESQPRIPESPDSYSPEKFNDGVAFILLRLNEIKAEETGGSWNNTDYGCIHPSQGFTM